MTSLSGRSYGVASSNDGQFDEFSRLRGRSNRAASLALPNFSLINLLDREQNVFESLNLTPPAASNGRRHSSHYFPETERDISPSPPQQQPPRKQQKSPPLPLVPPPVPKRTFQGKYRQRSRDTPTSTMNYSNSSYEHHQSATLDSRSYSQYRSEKNKYYEKNFRGPPSLEFPLSRYTDISPTKLQHYGLSTSFDDIGEADDLVLYDKKTAYVDSNKSSTDSNRSDTGYESMSAYTANSRRTFRGRFSSEDTQCSLDSFTSTELQQTDTTDSISNANYNDSPFSVNPKKSVFTFDRRFVYPKSESDADSPVGPVTPRRLPALPARKPVLKTVNKSRTMPPTPPIRTPELSKVLQNGKSLGQFQSQLTRKSEDEKGESVARQVAQISHQDSIISTDSFSLSSSPGFSSKTSNMEVPLLQHSLKMSSTQAPATEVDNLGPMVSVGGKGGGSSKKKKVPPKVSIRQDSNVSSDSFSQTSSPGYNSKLMETPLLANAAKMHTVKPVFKNLEEIEKDAGETTPTKDGNAITKSVSTPASLQTIVRLSNGSNMSLQHKILKARKNSNPYVTRGRLKFRLCQILLNAIALLVIAGGLAAYFRAYPTVKFINKTMIIAQPPPKPLPTILQPTTISRPADENPAPGVCLPVIVKFCQNYKVPYNYTIFPNYIGHFGQPEAQQAIEVFDALVDVQCSELVPLFLCSLFVPKCGSSGVLVPPCLSLCNDTMRRCGFFFGVFGLELPDYLHCKMFADSDNPDECVGKKELLEARDRNRKPQCSGFLCDGRRCIPSDWRCDGHVDCSDQTDESMCHHCGKDSIHCGDKRCMGQKHVCDGTLDCPWGQDERNCVRLSERNGDMGRGTLEVYKAEIKQWAPACVRNFDPKSSPSMICSMLGYRSVNASNMTMRISHKNIRAYKSDPTGIWRMMQRKQTNMLKEFTNCPLEADYPVLELTCTNYECGKIRNKRPKPSLRIIGGRQSNPGDWPFLAAILGGPEEVFYCAGVLIADQWVLTAAHCIGNHTLRNVKDWTIQLGITRRHSHSYYGQKVSVKMAIPHPQYDAYVAHDNDIALFQLASRVAFHEHLLPVCLPPPDLRELDPGTNCTVIGWGKREDKNSSPHSVSIGTSYEASVNEVNVPVLPRDLCIEWLEMLNVTEGMICAGYQEGGRDACQGDSGGPLLCPYPGEKDRWFVGGIVSWGIMCAHPKLPGVYANVPKYVPWIMQMIQKHSVATRGTVTLGR